MSNAADVLVRAAQAAHGAQESLSIVDATIGMAGQQAAVERHGTFARTRALVSIAQSLVVLATAEAMKAGLLSEDAPALPSQPSE